MLITQETKEKLNELLTNSFLLNMVLDNLVYQIDALGYVNIAPIFHHSFAHKAPEWADVISDFMVKMNALPERGNLVAENQVYGDNLEAIFAEVLQLMSDYRKNIIEAIDIAEFNDDSETKLFLEDFLLGIVDYRKQADIWLTYAKRFGNDQKDFDVHFEDFTTFIPVIK